jgi:hypothetical protein
MAAAAALVQLEVGLEAMAAAAAAAGQQGMLPQLEVSAAAAAGLSRVALQAAAMVGQVS